MQSGDRRVLEDPHARGFRRRGQASRVVQRMKMSAARVVESRAVALRREQRLHFGAFQESQLPIAVAILQLPLLRQQVRALPLLDRDVHLAPVQVAIDRVPLDAIADQPQTLDGDVPHPPGILEADLLLELVLAAGIAGDRLAAAATGGAVADPLRFEEDDPVTALGEMQGGGAAGDAAADHADVRLDLAGERGPVGRRERRMGVVRSLGGRHRGNPV